MAERTAEDPGGPDAVLRALADPNRRQILRLVRGNELPAGKIAAAMLTGERFDAAEARAIGLVTHVSADVEATVAELCDGIVAGAPRAVAETKRLLHSVPTMDRSAAFEAMRALSDELFAGPDAAKGMAAFAEKRTVIWD